MESTGKVSIKVVRETAIIRWRKKQVIYKNIVIEHDGNAVKLTTYIMDASVEMCDNKRPMILICPGGGYASVSDREAEPIAIQLNAMGYHAAVLRYSIAPVRYPAALLQVGESIKYLRKHADEYGILSDKIAVMGFSAGGHLAANFCTFWNRKWLAERLETKSDILKPNGMILCYPVITSGEYAHHDSFKNLLGEKYEEMKRILSLENAVSEDTPECFIWHTKEDETVPVENTLLFIEKMKEKGIAIESHIFDKGGHGLALASKRTMAPDGWALEPSVQCWVDFLEKWLDQWKKKAL